MQTERVRVDGPAPDGRAVAVFGGDPPGFDGVTANMPVAGDIRAVDGVTAVPRHVDHPAPDTPLKPVTRADAEAALACVDGDITALQRRAEAAHQAAWARAFSGPRSQGLAHDLRRVKATVADWLNPMIHKPPKRTEAAMVLLEAERRWGGVQAASWDPLAQMAGRGAVAVVQAAPLGAPQVIARLAGKGVTLALSEAGQIVAMPVGVLGEADRALVREHREALKLALGSAEVVA